jgi:hypothetical protein
MAIARHFAVNRIDHGQRTEAATIRQLVGDKIHAPAVVAREGGTTLLRDALRSCAATDVSAAAPAFLGIYAVKAFFAERPRLRAAAGHGAGDIPNRTLSGRARACGAARLSAILPASVVHRRARGSHHQQGAPRTDRVPAHQVVHDLTAA